MVRDFVRPEQDYISEIVIVDKGLEHQVELDDVLYIEANGNYLNLRTKEKTYLYRSTMNALATELNPETFLRIHRSVIIHLRYIKKCTYQTNSEYKFTMKDGTILLSGRSFKSGIVQYLSQ